MQDTVTKRRPGRPRGAKRPAGDQGQEVVVSTRVSRAQSTELRRIAADRGFSLAAAAREAIELYLDRDLGQGTISDKYIQDLTEKNEILRDEIVRLAR